MRFADDELTDIFDRTDGDYHICDRKLAFGNYGRFGERGAWEVEHSNPKVRGGTNRRSNLYAACISCNREKRDGSTRSARAKYGRTAAPLSANRKNDLRSRNGLIGAALGVAAARALMASPQIALAMVGFGALLGYKMEPDPQRR